MNPSIPHLPLFLSIFLTIYFTAHSFLFRHWSPKLRPEASSCFISLAHGSPAVLLASKSILNNNNNNNNITNNNININTNINNLALPNTPSQNTVLEYSIAYFITDLLHYIIFNPKDILFICHHLATLFVFITCRYLVSHGAYGVLVLLILAEVTSFLQNVWTLSNALRAESKIAAQVFDVLSPPFYAFYSVVRGVFGPVFVYKMVLFYLSGEADEVIPRWVWVSWVCVVVVAILVSIVWIWNRWVELYRERRRIGVIEEKKVR